MSSAIIEYVWIDGKLPVPGLRAKQRIVKLPEPSEKNPEGLPIAEVWNMDGSSTCQAGKTFDHEAWGCDEDTVEYTDCGLLPIANYPHPFLGGKHRLVLCEVLNGGGAHPTNTRHAMAKAVEANGKNPWIGFEQEFTLYKGHHPLVTYSPESVAAGQGDFYCGVGVEQMLIPGLSEYDYLNQVLLTCANAGIQVTGSNFEVMAHSHEIQVMNRQGALASADDVWMTRFILKRVAARFGLRAELKAKAMHGMNGAGLHCNYSDDDIRKMEGSKVIEAAAVLEKTHADYIPLTGFENARRMSGDFETSCLKVFTIGVGTRDTSIRIPQPVADGTLLEKYFEDRRPAACADPYLVGAGLVNGMTSDG